MAKKAPRRTAERILEVTLDLFNRFGEPNVSTTLISAELSISPGNLYYHYPAKDELINSLFDRYERSLNELLNASDGVRDVEDAWFYMHTLFELIWQYRFLYRDLNDLLSKNRRLETHFQSVLKNKTRSVRVLLDGIGSGSEFTNADEKAFRDAGCTFAYYHPTRSWRVDKLNRRTHRRILVIDGKVGFTGSVGFAEKWAGNADSPDHWRDV
ncbi:TetR/AcrR family transcriptional regulator, partial [Polaromonas sp.]|uniref:TetR/AcrR family transcriptional regulator n=1 Tax=Polaromonas sp. TaxID=1869339 RepID=UPI00286BB084